MLNPVTVARTSSSITISWTRPNFDGSVSYNIDLNDPNDALKFQEVAKNIVGDSQTMGHVLTGLDPFTTYVVKVTATNGEDTDVCQFASKTAEGSEKLFAT